MVVALGLESGRFSAVVKGSRKPRSRLAGLLEPPIELEGVLREGGHLDRLSQLQLRSAYASLRAELTALLTAGFFARLFAEALPERMASVEAYELFGHLLAHLSAGSDAVVTALWGQDRLLATLGVEPELSACLGCGDTEVRGYSPGDGGMLCNSCYGGSGFAVSSGALRLFRQLRRDGPALSSAMTSSEIKEIGRVLKLQFQRHLGLSEKVFRPVLPRSPHTA